MRNLAKSGLLAVLLLVGACTSTSVLLQGKDGSADASSSGTTGDAAGMGGQGTSGAPGSSGAGAGGAVSAIDSGVDGAALTDCTGLVCPSSQQSVKVNSPDLGIIQCACVAKPSTGLCADCTCSQSLCAQYGATCLGFALEGGLLCAEPG